MGFRFSLKWLLAAMVYGALAAAALTQSHWAYADALWFATLLACIAATLTTAFTRSERQARAAGFAIAAATLAVCLVFAPNVVPTPRILTALGLGQSQIVFASPSPMMATGVTAPNSYTPYPSAALAPGPYAATITIAPPLPASASTGENELRAANSLATVIVGLIGSFLGVAAYRSGRRTSPPSQTL